ITPAEAVLGAKIEVPTIDGTALMRIPPATSSGKTFRMRGRGVIDPRSDKRGDQFVRISIVVPKVPDESTKDLMRRYAERNPENPRDSLGV
ncbi:MAG: J domain-containing protein, partial [Acidobacteriia bacterium]|nr:J domain-containing protein [Terriglobia bacterium]